MSLLSLVALGNLDGLVQQQLPVLTAEAQDEGTLVQAGPTGRPLPGRGREGVSEGFEFVCV